MSRLQCHWRQTGARACKTPRQCCRGSAGLLQQYRSKHELEQFRASMGSSHQPHGRDRDAEGPDRPGSSGLRQSQKRVQRAGPIRLEWRRLGRLLAFCRAVGTKGGGVGHSSPWGDSSRPSIDIVAVIDLQAALCRARMAACACCRMSFGTAEDTLHGTACQSGGRTPCIRTAARARQCPRGLWPAGQASDEAAGEGLPGV